MVCIYNLFGVTTLLPDGSCIVTDSRYIKNSVSVFGFLLTNFTRYSGMRVPRAVSGSYSMTREAGFTGVLIHLNGDK